eukprot:CAMPEP_0183372242 /NCGR_PEP_ID=MMETSP0164_2-20130417/107950_1 /TAXON_ID=221442 /ORGANISM="Coccolithus pelagicus ssp braarudi, Strain PLY182g" /LENGTH=40 /DNA_ID= /DNA_START= /DNA_END= /DNA_ORIENTATION=
MKGATGWASCPSTLGTSVSTITTATTISFSAISTTSVASN